ncbi:MAG: hypothetical protein JST04_13690 [Bdellovibrionales bacterium]|nr:hypothetical protein [Bdellovibrionales bacterium]
MASSRGLLSKSAALPVLLLATLASCTTPEPQPTPFQPSGEFSLDAVLGDGEVGCRKMLDTYCSALHSPETQGNIRVGRGPDSLPILQGTTRNDFSSEYYLYSAAKLRAKDSLPADFRSVLDAQGYFDSLVRAMNRPPRSQMNLEKRALSMRREFELDQIWNGALSETVLRRMSKSFVGYHRLRDDLIPIEQSVERKRTRRELISEISRAIWKRDRNWSKVEANFEVLRERFLSVIDALDIPEDVRAAWKERMSSVKLVIPGAIPAIADSECSTTQANAFYYSYLNVLTVCAGDFNSEDILQTVAHELAHSLDFDRALYLRQKRSAFGRSLTALRREVCMPESFSCANWESFKSRIEPELAELKDFRPELPEFQSCLKRRTTSKTLAPADIQRLAEKEINDQVSTLANAGIFLRITKDRVPLPDGKTTKNPNYLDPCGYKIWSLDEEPIDDELTQLLFFTAEYRCSPLDDRKEKLRAAINASKALAVQVSAAAIGMEGEYSEREDLADEGYASSPVERFADVLGSYAFADYLSHMKRMSQRRHTFLASSSWQCDAPSLESLYPEENSVEQAFVFDSHSESDTRKKEMFTQPVRSALGCAQDFAFKSCELGFRKKTAQSLASGG